MRRFSSYDGVTSLCMYASVNEARKVFTKMVGQILHEMHSKVPSTLSNEYPFFLVCHVEYAHEIIIY